jgi:hypothetical protein
LPEKQGSTRSDPGKNKKMDSATPEAGLSKIRTRQEQDSGSCQRGKEQKDPDQASTRQRIPPERQDAVRLDPGKNKNADTATPEAVRCKKRTRQEQENRFFQRGKEQEDLGQA